ncbi:MAG: hypothetical protein DCC59_05465 [Chloroflexi bacterium]|nr:hypothetical protein [Anaerolineales bacterium]MCE7920466.1 hypothetical protein [Chloroflexi bacterium CFX1]MCQ3954115.1 hypothetical protein [Chloroflexota bacterium]MDL1920824.1 hypothetical protein [Chloroflexi bacterium CFX5]MCK6567715.1 hypothetical protein [Anaerolineales bacterium]
MEGFLCVSAIAGIVVLVFFFYLLNTARKKGNKDTNQFGKKEYTPVYVAIADKPDAIIRGMNKFIAEAQKTETAGDKWRWIPMMIFFAGIGLALVDVFIMLIGYSSAFVFFAGGFALWIAAFIMARNLRRSDLLDFHPRYHKTKDILHTLRDDLKPGATFLGHLDLTGSMLQTKVARETKDTQNRTTQIFNDPWLSLKAKLYDGNVLRVTAIQKTKKRKSYWKRSRISGKSKLKPEKFKGSQQELKVRIVVNPEAYIIKPNNQFSQGRDVGRYKIEQLSAEGGMINVMAVSPFEEADHEHILGFLKSAYTLLERKAA